MIVQLIGAFIAVVTLAVIFNVPKQFLFYAGVVATTSMFIYLLCESKGFQKETSVLVATLVIAFVSHSFARLFKAPVTLFLIPGILPMVPGVGTYRIVYNLIIEDNVQAAFYFNQTMRVAGMIAIGIFIMDTCFRLVKRKPRKIVRSQYREEAEDFSANTTNEPVEGSTDNIEEYEKNAEAEAKLFGKDNSVDESDGTEDEESDSEGKKDSDKDNE